jgi:hypothetical protein
MVILRLEAESRYVEVYKSYQAREKSCDSVDRRLEVWGLLGCVCACASVMRL